MGRHTAMLGARWLQARAATAHEDALATAQGGRLEEGWCMTTEARHARRVGDGLWRG